MKVLSNKVKILFRVIAFLEGVSYILLMTVGLYCKYQLDDPSYVKLLGMPHGLLFMAYLVLAYLLKDEQKWEGKSFLIILVASVIPFGTFYIDKKFLRN